MINTLTLNPAIDMIFYLDSIEKNATNRVKSKIKTVGGKGTHVSMNLSCLGLKNRAFGIAYGHEGKFIIDQLKSQHIETCFFYSEENESRINYILIEDDNSSTLIANRGITPSDEELDQLLALMEKNMESGDFLVIAGDASNIKDENIYQRISKTLEHKEIRYVIDSSGEVMKKSIHESPFLIKPNKKELSELCDCEIHNDVDIITAINNLQSYNIPIIAVSNGKEGSIVKIRDAFYKTIPPKITVNNTTGCGDSYLAGLLYGLEKNLTDEEILRTATAVSAAKAMSDLSFGFDREKVDELMEKTTVENIN